MNKLSDKYKPEDFKDDVQAYLILDVLRTLEEIRDKPGNEADIKIPKRGNKFDLNDAPKNPTEGQIWRWKPGADVTFVAGQWRSETELRHMAEMSVLAFLQGTDEATAAQVARSTGLRSGIADNALYRLVNRKLVIRVEGAYRLAAGDSPADVKREVVEFEKSLNNAEPVSGRS